MSKNNKKKNKNKNKIKNTLDKEEKNELEKEQGLNKLETDKLPLVSICTPTFNRRPFIPFLIKCIAAQTYPKSRIEWIIIDDGTDPIGDLVEAIDNVKYFYYMNKYI